MSGTGSAAIRMPVNRGNAGSTLSRQNVKITFLEYVDLAWPQTPCPTCSGNCSVTIVYESPLPLDDSSNGSTCAPMRFERTVDCERCGATGFVLEDDEQSLDHASMFCREEAQTPGEIWLYLFDLGPKRAKLLYELEFDQDSNISVVQTGDPKAKKHHQSAGQVVANGELTLPLSPTLYGFLSSILLPQARLDGYLNHPDKIRRRGVCLPDHAELDDPGRNARVYLHDTIRIGKQIGNRHESVFFRNEDLVAKEGRSHRRVHAQFTRNVVESLSEKMGNMKPWHWIVDEELGLYLQQENAQMEGLQARMEDAAIEICAWLERPDYEETRFDWNVLLSDPPVGEEERKQLEQDIGLADSECQFLVCEAELVGDIFLTQRGKEYIHQKVADEEVSFYNLYFLNEPFQFIRRDIRFTVEFADAFKKLALQYQTVKLNALLNQRRFATDRLSDAYHTLIMSRYHMSALEPLIKTAPYSARYELGREYARYGEFSRAALYEHFDMSRRIQDLNTEAARRKKVADSWDESGIPTSVGKSMVALVDVFNLAIETHNLAQSKKELNLQTAQNILSWTSSLADAGESILEVAGSNARLIAHLGLIGAVLDYFGGFVNGVQTGLKGKTGLSLAHFVTSLAAVASGTAAALQLTKTVAAFGLRVPYFWFISAVLWVGATLALWLLSESRLEAWLKACAWGVDGYPRYGKYADTASELSRLYRILCDFRVVNSGANSDDCWIYPSFLGQDSMFEVMVTFWDEENSSHKWEYTAKIFPFWRGGDVFEITGTGLGSGVFGRDQTLWETFPVAPVVLISDETRQSVKRIEIRLRPREMLKFIETGEINYSHVKSVVKVRMLIREKNSMEHFLPESGQWVTLHSGWYSEVWASGC